MNKILGVDVGFSHQARTWAISALSERNGPLFCDAPTIVANQAEVLSYRATFPEADVQLTPRNDYRCRARIDRETVVQAMASGIRSIAYRNFKGSVKERARHDAYIEVWSAMHVFLRLNCPPPRS